MIKRKDLLIVSLLRKNARETLTNMSKTIKMPISTIYDKLKSNEGGLIKKHTTLLDFSKIGFNTRASMLLRIKKSTRAQAREYLLKHQNINNVYKINNGYDFLVEVVFRHIREVEEFIEAIEEKFEIDAKEVYYLIDEIKREAFMSDPTLIHLVS